MEKAEILHQFERLTGEFERAAVEAAVARREEITPELLRILEDTVERAAQLDAEGGYMAHLYAMFLLAQFRETRAYALVVRFASLPGSPSSVSPENVSERGAAMPESDNNAVPRPVRCAIYTRKSSKEGLEKEFNSLAAQREAAEAYINSQRQQG